MFTLWYLGEKGHVRRDERSSYVVTSEGVDYVEANLNSNQLIYRLLKAPESGDSMREEGRVFSDSGVDGAASDSASGGLERITIV